MDKISVNTQEPPIVNIKNPNLIVIGDVRTEVLIPGDVKKIKDLVKSGVPLIILAQDDLKGLGMDELLPIELIKKDPMSSDSMVVAKQDNSYLTPAEIQFGQARKIYDATAKDTALVLAETTSGIPTIALGTYGKGKVLYYGLFQEYSDFKADIYYPVFWKRIIDTMIGGKKITELNKQTGFLQSGKESNIITPTGTRKASTVTMNKAGYYVFPSYTVAANLLSEEEQRLNRNTIESEDSELPALAAITADETKKKEITHLVLYIIAGLLVIELLYLKFRGDI